MGNEQEISSQETKVQDKSKRSIKVMALFNFRVDGSLCCILKIWNTFFPELYST